MDTLLHLLIAIPLIGAFAAIFGAPAKKTAIAAALANLGITLALLCSYDSSVAGYQFTSLIPILPQWGLSYHLGIDGLSLILLLLTAIVALSAVWIASRPDRLEGTYYACLLLIVAGATGAFVSLDLFFFYAFHELALIPTFILIGLWGTGDRVSAAWKVTIYLAVGSIVLLVGLLMLYTSLPDDLRTFNIVELQTLAKAGSIQPSCVTYFTILLGFGILIALFPFHTWAPTAYASAPAPAAMLHAGVLKKFGLYGILRVLLPLMPEAAQMYSDHLLILLCGNLLYVGLATIAQKELDLTLGYSSVMHMGYIFLGIASMTLIGLNGAALLIFAHGLSIAALFAMTGELRAKVGELLDYRRLGGLGKGMPFLAFTFGMATFASIGLPGFGNFAGELLVFFGAAKTVANADLTAFPYSLRIGALIIAVWGVVISAVYMLRAYRATFLGETRRKWADLTDIRCCARPAILLLLVALLIVGFYPQLILNLATPAFQTLLPALAATPAP